MVSGHAALLGQEIPERAVDRVAGGARTDRLLEPVAIEPARDLRTERHDALGDAFERLAIARIGHALAAAAVFAIGELRDHDRRFGFGTAADRKRAGNRPALDVHRKGGHRKS